MGTGKLVQRIACLETSYSRNSANFCAMEQFHLKVTMSLPRYYHSYYTIPIIPLFALWIQINLLYMILFCRYEDEINRRTECENDFVLLKKVSQLIHFHHLFSEFNLHIGWSVTHNALNIGCGWGLHEQSATGGETGRSDWWD